MSILLKVCKATTLKELPPVCRTFFTDDDEFVDYFACSGDETKAECVKDLIVKCLELNITDDHNILRMFMMMLKGVENDYDDEEAPAEEKQEVVVPMIQDDTELLKLKEENTKLKHELTHTKAVLQPLEEKKEEPPKTTRGRGRPPKHTNTAFKCILCDVCLASHGARHNHYQSKPHTNKVLSVLDEAMKFVDNVPLTKIIVKVRSHLDDPDFTMENPSQEYLENIKDYVRDKYNPITDILLVEGVQKEGLKHLSWKKLC
jgi:hypothetical protein